MNKPKNDDAILVRLPKELREKAEKIAREEDRPLPYIIRRLLAEEVAEKEQKLAKK